MIEVSDPEQQSNPTKVYRLIALIFIVVAMLIVGVALYMVFSRATVTILSEQQDVDADLIVDVSAKPNEAEVLGGVYEIKQSTSHTFPADSIVTVDMNVEGIVEIGSDLYRDQTLIASTRLLTEDGVLFRTKERVVIPAFGTAQVDVFSEENERAADLPEDANFTIPGLNESTRKFFTVTSVGDMSGGSKEVRMVTATDIAESEKLLVNRLENQIAQELRKQAKEDGVPMSGELFVYDTTRSTSDVGAGDEAESYTITVAVEGQGVFYDKNQFKKRVRQMLANRLPFDRELNNFSYDDSDLSAEKIDLIGNRANVRVHACGQSVISPEAAGLNPEKLAGITSQAAVQYLESLEGVSSASVKMSPFWAWRLPDSAEHIDVEVR